jgi:hypothetical protein
MYQITVETDLFEHLETKPHFINPCCFGEDFAAWLKLELSQFPELDVELSEPIQEDYDWGIWASQGKDRFWIALSYVGDGPQEAPAQWVISVSYDPGLNFVKRLFYKPAPLEQVQESTRYPTRRVVAAPQCWDWCTFTRPSMNFIALLIACVSVSPSIAELTSVMTGV